MLRPRTGPAAALPARWRWRLCALCAWLLLSPAAQAGNGFVILAVNEPPSSFGDEEGGVAGFSVDYLRALQAVVRDASPVRITSEEAALDTARREPNVLALAFSRTPEREKQFHWLALVLRKPWILYAPGKSSLTADSVDAMRRIPRIGVTRGDVRAEWLLAQHFDNLVVAPSHERNMSSLLSGKVDAVFYEPQGMLYLCRRLHCASGAVRRVYSPRSSDVYILMSKATAEPVVQRWQAADRQLKADGTYARIARKWQQIGAQQYRINSSLQDGILTFR